MDVHVNFCGKKLAREFGLLLGWMMVSSIHICIDHVVWGNWWSSITINTDDLGLGWIGEFMNYEVFMHMLTQKHGSSPVSCPIWTVPKPKPLIQYI